MHLITISTFDQEIGLFDWVGVYICVNSDLFQCTVIQQFNSIVNLLLFEGVQTQESSFSSVLYRYISQIMMDAIYVLLLLIFSGTDVYGELQTHSINVFKELLSSVLCSFGLEIPELVSQNRICFH